MSAHRGYAKGFTLVEILIVVVILGILAAIVIPHFTNATESAKASNLTTQLQSIRGQLEMAQVQHMGTYPNIASSGWTTMTTTTAPSAAYTASSSATAVGPYLQQAPSNPFEGSTTVAASASAGVGWVYSNSNGSIKAVVSSTSNATLGLSTNDVATY